jgi:hypothetical protein
VKRPAHVRAAVAKSRAARLRAIERRLVGQLRFLRRRDPDGHTALVACLRRIVGAIAERSWGTVGRGDGADRPKNTA